MASAQRVMPGMDRAGLLHSRRSNVLKYKKGQLVYDTGQPPQCLYLVADGKVRVSRFSSEGRCAIIDIYLPSEFFGESVLFPRPFPLEQAIALEETRLLSWTEHELDEIVSRQPQVALALIRAMAERLTTLSDRIEGLCNETIERRIARALLRLANRIGTREPDGSVRMLPLTHEFLAQYVGTSREMVTMHMNHLRRSGLVSYSRQAMIVYRETVADGVLP